MAIINYNPEIIQSSIQILMAVSEHR